MNSNSQAIPIASEHTDLAPAQGLLRSTWAGLAAYSVFASVVIAGLLAFYQQAYAVHHDIAGALMSARLAHVLGDAFANYSLYFPPAERVWFGAAVTLSELTSIRLDLTVVLMTGVAILVSATLAFLIRGQTVGASPLFLVLSVVVLVVLPILYKNIFGMREHLVILGLWPYLILRLSDPDNTKVGWQTRLVVGLWLGATLLIKYLYSLVVLLVELVDAALQRRVFALLRIENLIAGGIVALYVFFWLVIDPAQREAIGAVVSAIDANLADRSVNIKQAAIHSIMAVFLLLLAYIYKLPVRVSAIGLAIVVAAIVVSWIQSRWYTHHLFPITAAYIAWVWMIHREVKLLWIVAVSVMFVRPIAGEFASTSVYQRSVAEFAQAMDSADISVSGKRVGLLNMHPSPTNQYLASHGGIRWVSSVNNSYVASVLKPLDTPENEGMISPAAKLDDPGIQMLHDEMLRLWEDMPPDALILDQSTNWPLRHIEVEWKAAFAEDERFRAILEDYEPVYSYSGEQVSFTYYERAE